MGWKTSFQLSSDGLEAVHSNKTNDLIYLFISCSLNWRWRYLQFLRPTSLLAVTAASVVKGADVNWVCCPGGLKIQDKGFCFWYGFMSPLDTVHIININYSVSEINAEIERWEQERDAERSRRAWVHHHCWGVCYMLWSLSWDSNP